MSLPRLSSTRIAQEKSWQGRLTKSISHLACHAIDSLLENVCPFDIIIIGHANIKSAKPDLSALTFLQILNENSMQHCLVVSISLATHTLIFLLSDSSRTKFPKTFVRKSLGSQTHLKLKLFAEMQHLRGYPPSGFTGDSCFSLVPGGCKWRL